MQVSVGGGERSPRCHQRFCITAAAAAADWCESVNKRFAVMPLH